ncbi:ABC transporter permease [Clostridium sp.]|uniref:ABC transporter permease n=1 Tax=Clostridium sp. TaxID=1506 RepID=UPI003217C2D0
MFSIRFKENFIRELKKNKLGIFALICLALIIILSIFAFLTPYNPDTIDMSNQFISPNLKHIFGTDELGRDYFTRALYGARISLIVGVLSMMVSIFIGTLVGAISGLLGGKVDAIIMRIIDMLMSIPLFFLLLIVNSYLRPSIANIIIIIGIFGWMSIARIVRSETLSIKERDYILCSKALGSNNINIVKKHIIPNAISTVIVAASINIADAILMESSLSFLGLGVQQPMASLGSMLQTAQSRIGDKTYLAIFPGLMILLIVLSFNVLGDILRVSLDPAQGD